MPVVSTTIVPGAGTTFGACGVRPCFGCSAACFGAVVCDAGTAAAAPGDALCGAGRTAFGRSADVGRLVVIDVVGCVVRHGIHSIATPVIAAAAAYEK